MAGSQTLRFEIIGSADSATRAFKDTATNAALAARGARQLSDSLAIQSKSAQVSASATVSLAKSDDILVAAQEALAGATDDATGSLGALKLRLDELNGKVASARVSLAGNKDAQAQLDAIDARLIDLDHKTSTPTLDIQGIAKATAELSAVDVALDKVGGPGGSAQGAASSLGLLASPMGALVGAGVLLSPVLVTSAVGLGAFGAAAVGAARPILAAAQATGGLQDNLQTLNPQQQQAARGLLALENQYNSFSKALEPEVFSAFNTGLGIASTLLHDAGPVAQSAGKGINSVLAAVNTDLNSAQWKQFFGFMAASAAPDIQLLGTTIGALVNDLPPLLEDLQPVATGFLGIATDALKAVGALENFEHLAQQTNQLAEQSQKSGGHDPFSLGAIAGDAKNAGDQLLNSLYPGFSKVTDAAGKFAKSQGDAATAASKGTEATREQAAAQQAAVTAATDLSANLSVLENRYGLSASQAQALVTAAGQTDKALQGSGDSATGALTAIEKYANASLNAQTPTQQLAGDISVLDNNTLGATVQLNAFTAAWNIIIGNSVSDQTAILNTAQAFESYSSAVKTSGRNSTAAQQAFLSIITSMGTGLTTLKTNGATVGQLNSFYQTTIDRLNTLHNLTPAQRADVQGITKDYNVWANSTAGLNRQTLGAADTIKNNFTANLKNLGDLTPGITGDVSNLANSVLKTGTTSAATQGDRAKLIADLHQAGLTAADARTFVNNLQTSINDLRGKTVTVGVVGTGSGDITISGKGVGVNIVDQILLRGTFARGGQVGGSGNHDTVPAMLTPGEVVVPKGMVAAGAVDHLRGKLPGFAGGGLVNLVPDTSAAISGEAGTILASQASAIVRAQTAAIKKVQAAQEAAAARAAGPLGSGTSAGEMANGRQLYNYLLNNLFGGTRIAAAGATASIWGESNWDPFAQGTGGRGLIGWTPPSAISNAAFNGGMATQLPAILQFVNSSGDIGAIEQMDVAGSVLDAANIWGVRVERFGINDVHPQGVALATQIAGLKDGGMVFDNGGTLAPGANLVFNRTGRPEPVIPAGRGGGGAVHIKLELGDSFRRAGLTSEQLADIRATVGSMGGDVQTALGRS